MSKKETLKFIVQMIASIATAIVTALGTTSCMGVWRTKKSAEVPYPSADFLPPSKNFPTYALFLHTFFVYLQRLIFISMAKNLLNKYVWLVETYEWLAR